MFIDSDREKRLPRSTIDSRRSTVGSGASRASTLPPPWLRMSVCIFLNCEHDVAVVRLVNEPRQKGRPHPQQFLGKRSFLLDDRRIEAFQHVGVCLERQYEKSLQFPVVLLGVMPFELIRDTIQRPMKLGRGQENPRQSVSDSSSCKTVGL